MILQHIKRPRYFAALAIFILSALPSLYYFYKHAGESQIVHRYLVKNSLSDLPVSKSSAFRIARQVASDFNVDPRTFKTLNMNDRPFLREDAGTLLTYREGLCGEGTRVIVRLLNASGFNATRITLYDRYMQYAHTLVSVELDGDSFWIDSINSSDSLTTLLEQESISAKDFDYLFYQDKIEQRLSKIDSFQKAEKSEEFKKNLGMYYLFSYEAVPWTKVLAKVGINMRVFNLERPPHLISSLAEQPFLIMAICYLVLSLIVTWLLSTLLFKYLKRIH
jgi:hypothetical protein